MIQVVALASPQSATLYWYVVRGSGFVAYLLLTIGVLLGLLLSLRWRNNSWPRLLTEGLHQFLQLLALFFLAIHIVSTLLDTYIHFEWYQMLVPFSGPYRGLWLAAGIIAMYLAIALAASIYVRRMIGYRVWRALHYAAFAAWLLALAHGLATGTDTRQIWAIVVYAASALGVTLLLVVRFGGITVRLGRPPRLRSGVVTALVAALLLGSILTAAGPLQRGWAKQAGSIPGPTASVILPRGPVHDVLSGMARPYDQYVLSTGYRMLTLDLSGNGRQAITVDYRLLIKRTKTGNRFARGLYSLVSDNGAWGCSGTVTYHGPDRLTGICQVAGQNEALLLVTRLSIDPMGRVTGSMALSLRTGTHQRISGGIKGPKGRRESPSF